MKKVKKLVPLLVLIVVMFFTFTANAESPFTDVDSSFWGYDDVIWAYENGVMNGVDVGIFAPNETMTRAMFVTVLARMSGVDANYGSSTIFTDVPTNQYYTGAVKWAYEHGIVNGTAPTEFSPNKNITREQLCTMVLRYVNYRGITLDQKVEEFGFTDSNKISDYAKEAVKKCQLADLVRGMEGGVFSPQGESSRAQAAAILHRLTVNFLNDEHQHTYVKYKCVDCGTVDKEHAYEYLIEWLKVNGEVNGEHIGIYEYLNEYSQLSIVYDASGDYVYVSTLTIGEDPDGSSDGYCLLDLSNPDGNYEYWCSYGYNPSLCDSFGKIAADTYTSNSPLVCDEYHGPSEMRAWFLEYSRLSVNLNVVFLGDYISQCIPEISLEDLGFSLYYNS